MPKRPRDTFPPSSRFVADEMDTECPICMDPCWNPTRADPCGHVACRGCLDRVQQCPMCRGDVLSTSPCGTAMSRRCHSVRVTCQHCPWKGTRKQQVIQAHVVCPDRCKTLAGEKLTTVMRDVYPAADVKRRNLLDALNLNVLADNRFFIEQMLDVYSPNLKVKTEYESDNEEEDDEAAAARDAIVEDWGKDRHAAIQSLSGPSSCLLWTLFDACGSKNTELAVGLALHVLAIPPASPVSFPTGLDWQCGCLLVATHTNMATMRELLRNGLTVPNPLPMADRRHVATLFGRPVEFGDYECLQLLVKNCAFVDLKASGLFSEILIAAALHRRSRWIKRLVSEFGCDVNEAHVDTTSYPLHMAVVKNDANCISELIGLGANVDQHDADLGAPIHAAVLKADLECLAIILSANANVEVKTNIGYTPLYMAVVMDKLGHFRALLAAGANPNEPFVDPGVGTITYPLFLAVQKGAVDFVSELIRSGADVDQEGYLGRTAMHRAVLNDDTSCLDVLLAAHANTEIKDRNGETPLYLAVREKNLGYVKALLAAGANPNESCVAPEDGYISYPLYVAVQNNTAGCMSELIRFGADVDQEGYLGRTAMHRAVLNDGTSCLDVLLAANTKTITDTSLNTLLTLAARNNKLDHLKVLVAAGAIADVISNSFRNGHTNNNSPNNNSPIIDTDINIPIPESTLHLADMTPLIVAAVHGHLAIVEYLHELTKPDVESPSHRNAVHITLTGDDNMAVVEFLIERGYAVTTHALGMAVIKKNVKAVELLLQPRFELSLTHASDGEVIQFNLMRFAVESGSHPIIKLLFEHGADLDQINEQDAEGRGHRDSIGYLRRLRGCDDQ